MIRMARRTASVLSLLLLAALASVCQMQAPDKPKVRAITVFVRLDREHYVSQLQEAEAKLSQARQAFERAGWQVETVRMTMQSFPEFVKGLGREQAMSLLLDLDRRAQDHYAFDIGAATMHDTDDPAMMLLMQQFLAHAKVTNATAIIADDAEGIHSKAIQQAAGAVKYLAQNTANGEGNFRFAAAAMVSPYTPFFPASFYSGPGGKFSVGLESANVVLRVLSEKKRENLEQNLQRELTRYASEAEAISRQVANQTGWEYVGLDPTPAPLGDVSVGAAIEAFTGQSFGSSGTLHAAFLITSAVRSVGVQQVGYSGLMLPVLEDNRVARRWSEGKVGIDSLLAYSAVCATGLDTVPLPGEISQAQIARILTDVAALAVKWQKPLTARLLPVKGKTAGEQTTFDNPYLTNARLQALP
jgi:uncharacterized protein